ncbi:DNA translocase FtsK 4TM domain-containing protein [bacterium]|nr:DNA translocase FtsK [Candidatus Omnitrophota bacterium]MBU2528341.1 DNA translocase FtsK 4TM domain-containing protein [bacterium]MBU3930595.1 DNA translocase FtsK 4TM domain-containing protein [bacterium]MBU4122758.1 DNA translocase FtsK 4TM domain-containing protein [bacterium]
MSKKKESQAPDAPDRSADIAGILLVGAGLMMALWLNWEASQGFIGRNIAAASYYLFGWVSNVFSLALIVSGALLIAKITVPNFWKKLIGLLMLLISVCSAVHLFMMGRVPPISPAGKVGELLGLVLRGLFGKKGSFVVSFAGALAAFILAFDIGAVSLFKVMAWPFVKIALAAGALWRAVKSVLLLFKKRAAVSAAAIVRPNPVIKPRRPVPAPAPEKAVGDDDDSGDIDEDDDDDEPASKPSPPADDDRPQRPEYLLPGTNTLLKSPRQEKESPDVKPLEEAFASFGISAEVRDIVIGPGVIRYELSVPPGQKISAIQSLSNDIAMQLRAESIRILAPIPGKAAVGIEVPRKNREKISLRELLESESFTMSGAKLPVILGKNVVGDSVVADLSTMPHLLIGGATGSGKSVTIHNLILSLLYKYSPYELKLILIDAKMVELTVYNDIPHLLSRVQTDVHGAVASLKWAVFEMQRRLKLFSENGVRDLAGYHETCGSLPYIVIVIDELADLMAVAQKDMELAITRLSQMSRACGIHLVLCTQRPSVNVITGVIKANLPARISLHVLSKIDSRTILDSQGGEALLLHGDMLYLQPGSSFLERIQAPFISRKEVQKIVKFIRSQNVDFDYMDLAKEVKKNDFSSAKIRDDIFWEAAEFVISQGKASTSLLQRRFRIGYGRAAGLIDTMYELGVVGDDLGPTKGKEILCDAETLERLRENL